MNRLMLSASLLILAGVCVAPAQEAAKKAFEMDKFKTSAGELEITFIGHGTLMFKHAGKVIHVDPVTREADYTKLPKADLVLITHEHGDHLDLEALNAVRKLGTIVALTETCAKKFDESVVLKNGEAVTMHGVRIEAVPAYNIVNKRGDGTAYHPKGVGNGYVLTFGDKRVYVAGDTENTPEMAQLQKIDIAFLPMNLPYTMTPEMVAEAARSFKPKIVYPYHYGNTDTSKLQELLQDDKGIEVRIRKM